MLPTKLKEYRRQLTLDKRRIQKTKKIISHTSLKKDPIWQAALHIQLIRANRKIKKAQQLTEGQYALMLRTQQQG